MLRRQFIKATLALTSLGALISTGLVGCVSPVKRKFAADGKNRNVASYGYGECDPYGPGYFAYDPYGNDCWPYDSYGGGYNPYPYEPYSPYPYDAHKKHHKKRKRHKKKSANRKAPSDVKSAFYEFFTDKNQKS